MNINIYIYIYIYIYMDNMYPTRASGTGMHVYAAGYG